jgi:hypothetical protein
MEEERALHLLRRQRHSFLNHLQVISGWLQLGRPEKAGQYLETVSAQMAGESDVLRRAPAGLGLLVLELGLEAETHGARLEWQAAGPIDDLDLPALREMVLAALNDAADRDSGERCVVVRLGPGAPVVHNPAGESEG